jgi:phosphohistidine swiveling domain-containing protein
MGTRRDEAPSPRADSADGHRRPSALDEDRDPLVLHLDDERAQEPGRAGAKAANLARAAGAGFPILPGAVITTEAFDSGRPGWTGSSAPGDLQPALHRVWAAMPDGTQLVVRSSSTVEDIGASSMAGQFLSRLGIDSYDEFVTAVGEVQASAASAAGGGPTAPMAVLVQHQVDAAIGGVMFGIDPMTGDEKHVLVEAVTGGPEHLVSGTVTAQRYVLGQRGRVIEGPDPQADGEPLLDRGKRRRLAALARDAGKAFGAPQDIEWAFDTDGALWLLQSRPVTARGAAATAHGPLLGPGPLAETFPLPLRRLEEDLWLAPLRRGIADAIAASASVPASRVAASPLIVTVGGWVACDLLLFGVAPQKASAARLFDPRVGGRRVISSWRIGRLRAVLPELAEQISRRVDAELAALGALDQYTNAELMEIIQRSRRYLASVHGHEVLAGVLLDGGSGATAAGAALRALARGRDLGLPDDEIVHRWPVVLALTPPRLVEPVELPATAGVAAVPPQSGVWTAQSAELPPREALRLRARWLQEVTARAVDLIARRLTDSHCVPTPVLAPQLGLAELGDLVAGWPPPSDLKERAEDPGPPLPAHFRLDANGDPVPVRFGGAHRSGGRGASPGRAQGRAVHDPADATAGDILVTRTLDPRLALHLPQLAGMVSETGSVLSHLAILAREFHVPTVVAVHDALDRFPAGAVLVVDGDTGEVDRVEPDAGEASHAAE